MYLQADEAIWVRLVDVLVHKPGDFFAIDPSFDHRALGDNAEMIVWYIMGLSLGHF